MDFGFTEEQTLIKDSARELLSKELPKDKLREIQESETGFSKELWDKIVTVSPLPRGTSKVL